MKWYLVFSADRRPIPGHTAYGPIESLPTGLVWASAPVGVFRAGSSQQACQAAAKKQGSIGTFFAVEGEPWGLEMQRVDGVDELGYGAQIPELTNGD